MAAKWAITVALGLSFTKPSDLSVDLPGPKTHAVFHNVRWAGQSFVSPLYYVVRINDGNVALDFTHFKIIAATQDTIHETGTWKGEAIDDTIPLDRRIQHFEVSHGVNSFGLVGIFRNPNKRGAYIGAGPVFFMPHAETHIDDKTGEWGYAYGGFGSEIFIGDGSRHVPFAEIKHTDGLVKIGVVDGTATIPISSTQLTVAP